MAKPGRPEMTREAEVQKMTEESEGHHWPLDVEGSGTPTSASPFPPAAESGDHCKMGSAKSIPCTTGASEQTGWARVLPGLKAQCW